MQTLTTGKIIGIVLGLLVVIGGGYMLTQGSKYPETAVFLNTPDTEGTVKEDTVVGKPGVKETEARPSSAATKGSFKDLLGKAGAQKCSISQSSDISKSDGVFYFSGGKGRGEFTNTLLSGPGKGTSIKSSMIMDGKLIYTWDDATKQGIKMSMDMNTGAVAPAGTPTGGNTMADQFNQAYDYNCESWKADASLFVAPTSVTFIDMNEMMKGLPNMGN